MLAAHRVALLRKEQEKIRWLNSPNNYQKVELLETGTDSPKVITKVCNKSRFLIFSSGYQMLRRLLTMESL